MVVDSGFFAYSLSERLTLWKPSNRYTRIVNSNPGAELVRKRWEITTPEMRREFMACVRTGRSIPIVKGQIIEL